MLGFRRNRPTPARRCPACGALGDPALPYCTQCGHPAEHVDVPPPPTLATVLGLVTQRQSWTLFLLAVAPILLEALHLDIISGMMIYFSLFWFFLFRRLTHARGNAHSLAADILAYLITATVGVGLAAAVESLAVALGAAAWIQSPHLVTAVAGSVLFVGLVEEFSKQLWVIALAVWHRLRGHAHPPLYYMMVGIVSGLGFSAVENMDYVKRGIFLDMSQHVAGVGTLTALSRALYTPFLHALWAAVAGYAIGVAFQRRRLRYALIGLGSAGLLHGLYDACIHISTLAGLAVVAVSYLVFLTVLAWAAPPAPAPAGSTPS